MKTRSNSKKAGNKFKHLSKSKSSLKRKVECGSQTEETAFQYSSIMSPSSTSSSSASNHSSSFPNLVENESYTPSQAPPLLYGLESQSSKHNRGRPRKNPPTLQPQISSNVDDVPGETEQMSLDNSEEDSEELVKETKVKKGKLSVLVGAAKHWERQQNQKQEASRDDCVYEFTDDASDQVDERSNTSESESDSSTDSCDKKHSKVLKFKNRKLKHKEKLVATKKNVKKYKRYEEPPSSKVKKNREKYEVISSNSGETKSKYSFKHRTKYSKSPVPTRPSSSVSNISLVSNTTDEGSSYQSRGRKPDVWKSKKNVKSIAAESDASSCLDDISLHHHDQKRADKQEQKPMQQVYQQFSTKVSNNFGKTSGLIFSKKYCTLRPDAFWKTSEKRDCSDEGLKEMKSELLLQQSDVKSESSATSIVATKASLKEMPNVPRNQVQQMLNVLASATRMHNKVSKKKKEKEDKKQFRDIKFSYDTGNDTQSEDDESCNGSTKRRNKKGWKSKHKNVVDPVFLGELEHLIRDIASVQLEIKLSKDFWPDRPSDSVPSIFKRRKIFTTRRKRENNKATKRGKSSKSSEAIEVLDLTNDNDADEQRLPLKKRHHHLQGGESKGKSLEESPPLIQIKSPEKISREFRTANMKKEENFSEKRNNGGIKILQDKLIKKPTAADRIVEKLGIQIKKENAFGANESRFGSRRVSKDFDSLEQQNKTSSGNSSRDQKTSKSHRSDQNKIHNIQVKSESKLKETNPSKEDSATFVDNIQGCIDKYTKRTSSLDKQRVNHTPSLTSSEDLFKSARGRRVNPPATADETFKGYLPIFSSPEPEPATSGRESSLSQSSNSSDICIIKDLEQNVEQFQVKINIQ